VNNFAMSIAQLQLQILKLEAKMNIYQKLAVATASAAISKDCDRTITNLRLMLAPKHGNYI